MTINKEDKIDNRIRLFGQSSDSDAIKELTKYVVHNIANCHIDIEKTFHASWYDENGDYVDLCKDNPARNIIVEMPNESISLDGIYKPGITWIESQEI